LDIIQDEFGLRIHGALLPLQSSEVVVGKNVIQDAGIVSDTRYVSSGKGIERKNWGSRGISNLGSRRTA